MAKCTWRQTAIGRVGVLVLPDGVAAVYLPAMPDSFDVPAKPTPLGEQTLDQIEEYLAGKRRQFLVPLALSGSAWDWQVWSHLRDIPYGQTRTYAQIATALGKPTAARAVGRACASNPVPLLIPCHRVVTKTQPGQYVGGQALKIKLLQLEKEIVARAQIAT